MPQGSWLGRLSFLVLIDLTTGCLEHKYVDDTTLSEVSELKSHNSHMNAFTENVLNWADQNNMQINTTKTKEIIFGPLSRSDIPQLSTAVCSIERVLSVELLTVYIESTLCWPLYMLIIW